MDLQSPAFNALGTIDAEIHHPRHGWIRCTLAPDDPDTAALYAAALDMGPAAYVPPAPAPVSPEQVKAEANRRILALCPEWKQRNLTAQAVLLVEKGRATWTDDDRTAWDAGQAIWQQIKTIRDASDRIEAMPEIPQDYAQDQYWG